MPMLLDIPDELFIKILSSLNFLQLVRSQLVRRFRHSVGDTVSNVRQVCKRFDHAVRSAGELQYIVELGVGGLADGPQHPFNTFERLNYLTSRRLEWRDPCVEEIGAIHPLAQAHLWKIRAATLVRTSNRNPLLQGYFDVVDIVRLDPSSAEQSRSSYYLDSEHTGFEFDPGQDLLVLFNRYPTLPWYVLSLAGRFCGTQSAPSSSVSFSLLSLNAGTPHPEAAKPSSSGSVFRKGRKGATRQPCRCHLVWEEILVVQLSDGLTKFYFVDWRTGVVIAASAPNFLPHSKHTH
jgi:hypothetical protein